MNKREIQQIEVKANQAILSKSVVGNDRTKYKTVAYCARGQFECETIQGSRDYLTASEVSKVCGF